LIFTSVSFSVVTAFQVECRNAKRHLHAAHIAVVAVVNLLAERHDAESSGRS
jgi:hypothetical protein